MISDENSDDCPSQKFLYFVNLLCYTGEHPDFISRAYAALAFIFLILGTVMFFKSRIIRRQMIEPSGMPEDENETYNILSLDIIDYTRLMLVFTITLLCVLMVEFSIGPYFQQIFESNKFINCEPSQPGIHDYGVGAAITVL